MCKIGQFTRISLVNWIKFSITIIFECTIVLFVNRFLLISDRGFILSSYKNTGPVHIWICLTHEKTVCTPRNDIIPVPFFSAFGVCISLLLAICLFWRVEVSSIPFPSNHSECIMVSAHNIFTTVRKSHWWENVKKQEKPHFNAIF